MKDLILSDIDGVVADIRHRLHYQAEKNYEAFYGIEMANDSVIESGDRLVRALDNYSHYADTYWFTGRPERTRGITELFLKSNSIEYSPKDKIYMRKDGDYRSSDVIKIEQLEQFFRDTLGKVPRKKPDNWNNIFFIDDDPKNIRAVWNRFPWITCILFGADRLGE